MRKSSLNKLKQSLMNNNGEESWQRGKLLGRGHHGTVHLAHFPNPNPTGKFQNFPPLAAVKSTVHSQYPTSLSKEKSLYDSIGPNPNIIRCFGEELTISEDGKFQHNIFLEYAAGRSLSDLIEKSNGKGLLESQATAFTRSILRGLKHIHDAGFVHCDVKADNVMLVEVEVEVEDTERNLLAKIGDLGLVKREENPNARSSYLKGTDIYLAPECFELGIQNKASDIWALGYTVLSMLTGKLDWYGMPRIEGTFSEEAEDFIRKCLSWDYKDRPTAGELLGHPFLVESDVERRPRAVVCREMSFFYPSRDGFGAGSEDRRLCQCDLAGGFRACIGEVLLTMVLRWLKMEKKYIL